MCIRDRVELSQPEAYDEKYAKWKYDDLPILPEHWQYQVSASTKKPVSYTHLDVYKRQL